MLSNFKKDNIERKEDIEIYDTFRKIIQYYSDKELDRALTGFRLKSTGAILCFNIEDAKKRLEIVEQEIERRNKEFEEDLI